MDRLNLFDPEVRANPYPHYARLRATAPVSPIDPGGIWAVSRHDDIMSVFKNPSLFSSQGLRPLTLQPWLEKNPTAESLVLMDPPRHTATRALVTHAFSTRVIPRIEPLARAVCQEFAQRAPGSGVLDICTELASNLPARVIANLLGLEDTSIQNLRIWTEDLISVNPGTPPAAQARIIHSIAELQEHVKAMLDSRRRLPRDDLASNLLEAEIDGERMSEEDLVSFFFLLITAGFETTTHLIANSLRILASHPELLARLKADSASIPKFVEEVLRFDPSVHGTMRLVTADTQLAGVDLPAGSLLTLLLASAMRDEQQFEHPDRFDIDRKERTSLAFGHGIHFCLGAALARAEVRIALEELVPRIRGVRLVGESVWNLSLTVRGPTKCDMELLAA